MNDAYRSDFGGLWTDRANAKDEIEHRLSAGDLTANQAEQLRFWVENGYIILEGAVSSDAIDRFRNDITTAFEQGDEDLLVSTTATAGGYQPLKQGTSPVRARVVDSYAMYPSARDVLFSEPIVEWLRLVLDRDPLLFQSLSFDRGSQQGMHQDTAYVVVSSPLELAAAWIALEDVQEGSGELMYYEGSHNLPEYKFSGEHKHWSRERDGDDQHEEWARLLNENATRLGMARKTFLPRKGDVLIWSADLAHGGAPAADESLTRRSLVGHYCPRDIDPNWFTYRDDRFGVGEWNGAHYVSEHYAIGAEPAGTPTVPPVEPSPVPAPTSRAARRRTGGLVGKVRARFR